MRNILLFTTLYPTPDTSIHTPVVHYFAKEWVKMGYNVTVIHYRSVFPSFYYKIAALFKKIAIWYIGNDDVQTKPKKNIYNFIQDGVHVNSLPLYKLLPHGGYSNNTITTQIKNIIKFTELENFTPDIIIGHFHNPQIEIVSKLKSYFPNAKTCIVIHEYANVIKKTYSNSHKKLFQNIDVWGFRSVILRNDFFKLFGNNLRTFICYSGIPELFFKNDFVRDFSKGITQFIYIGNLMKRKYPSVIIPAIYQSIKNQKYSIKFIGRGNMETEVKSVANKLNIIDSIELIGQVNRENIINHLDKSDCFIMISKNEVFGLVYLEAMARGCITIGSRNEGIDGIIKHGVNGFLCEAGNSNELAELLVTLSSLPNEVLKEISENAKKTALEYQDYNVAKYYVNSILN